MTKETRGKIQSILDRSRWMRFSLTYGRGRWCAVFHHERGRIFGKAWAEDPTEAIGQAHAEALVKSADWEKKR